MDKDSRAVTVTILGKALHYNGGMSFTVTENDAYIFSQRYQFETFTVGVGQESSALSC